MNVMVDEFIMMRALSEQKEEIEQFDCSKLVDRMEESLFELDTSLAQVVTGVRRCGKSTLCLKVLLSRSVQLWIG